MTPDQWRRVSDLFEAALRLDPAEREAWLERACGRDAQLRAEVARLLAHDERVNQDLFLSPPEVPVRNGNDAAIVSAFRDQRDPAFGLETVDLRGAKSPEAFSGFTPKAAIAGGKQMQPVA